MLILDLWGIGFHAVVVFDLGKDFLFKYILGRCVMGRFWCYFWNNFGDFLDTFDTFWRGLICELDMISRETFLSRHQL